MIDQFGKEAKVGDTIVWVKCRQTKFRKHHTSLHKGKIVHIDTKVMYNGHIAETILAERDYATQSKSEEASVLLIDPEFIIIESNSS